MSNAPARMGRPPVPRDRKKISRNVYMDDATKAELDRLAAESGEGVTASEILTTLIWAEGRRRREMNEGAA